MQQSLPDDAGSDHGSWGTVVPKNSSGPSNAGNPFSDWRSDDSDSESVIFGCSTDSSETADKPLDCDAKDSRYARLISQYLSNVIEMDSRERVASTSCMALSNMMENMPQSYLKDRCNEAIIDCVATVADIFCHYNVTGFQDFDHKIPGSRSINCQLNETSDALRPLCAVLSADNVCSNGLSWSQGLGTPVPPAMPLDVINETDDVTAEEISEDPNDTITLPEELQEPFVFEQPLLASPPLEPPSGSSLGGQFIEDTGCLIDDSGYCHTESGDHCGSCQGIDSKISYRPKGRESESKKFTESASFLYDGLTKWPGKWSSNKLTVRDFITDFRLDDFYLPIVSMSVIAAYELHFGKRMKLRGYDLGENDHVLDFKLNEFYEAGLMVDIIERFASEEFVAVSNTYYDTPKPITDWYMMIAKANLQYCPVTFEQKDIVPSNLMYVKCERHPFSGVIRGDASQACMSGYASEWSVRRSPTVYNLANCYVLRPSSVDGFTFQSKLKYNYRIKSVAENATECSIPDFDADAKVMICDGEPNSHAPPFAICNGKAYDGLFSYLLRLIQVMYHGTGYFVIMFDSSTKDRPHNYTMKITNGSTDTYTEDGKTTTPHTMINFAIFVWKCLKLAVPRDPTNPIACICAMTHSPAFDQCISYVLLGFRFSGNLTRCSIAIGSKVQYQGVYCSSIMTALLYTLRQFSMSFMMDTAPACNKDD